MITIAIPFYNAADYLDMAIQSVFNQTYTNWKLVLIDDGSTDGSFNIASKYTKDGRVTLVADGIHVGLSTRLNDLSMIVDTTYLARMDADDIMHPLRIEKQLYTIELHPEIDVLGTNAYSIDQHNLVQGIRFKYSGELECKTVSSFIHPSILARTTWFRENQYDIYATRIEDVDLWFRTSSKFNFQMLTEPLMFYREFSDRYYRKYFKGFLPTMYLLKKHWFSPEVVLFCIKYYISGFLCFFLYLLGKEHEYIKRRNAIRINSHFIDYYAK